MPDALEVYDLDLRYYGNAVGYQVAIGLLVSAELFSAYQTNVLPPLSALIGFCVELALKAFLANRLDDPGVLTKLPARHNLEILLEMSADHGMPVGGDIEKLVCELNENHRLHFTRYMPAQGSFRSYDNWLAIVDATSGLCELVRRKINVDGRTAPTP